MDYDYSRVIDGYSRYAVGDETSMNNSVGLLLVKPRIERIRGMAAHCDSFWIMMLRTARLLSVDAFSVQIT